jgi:hypothetical protein
MSSSLSSTFTKALAEKHRHCLDILLSEEGYGTRHKRLADERMLSLSSLARNKVKEQDRNMKNCIEETRRLV